MSLFASPWVGEQLSFAVGVNSSSVPAASSRAAFSSFAEPGRVNPLCQCRASVLCAALLEAGSQRACCFLCQRLALSYCQAPSASACAPGAVLLTVLLEGCAEREAVHRVMEEQCLFP